MKAENALRALLANVMKTMKRNGSSMLSKKKPNQQLHKITYRNAPDVLHVMGLLIQHFKLLNIVVIEEKWDIKFGKTTVQFITEKRNGD